jgi:hypothetical protein
MPQPEDAPAMESAIGVHSDIQNLLLKCEEDPANATRYANLILDLDPSNSRALQYLKPTKKKRW